MVPPPPGRVSISICCPHASVSFWPKIRATISGPGPTMIRMGLVGNSCAPPTPLPNRAISTTPIALRTRTAAALTSFPLFLVFRHLFLRLLILALGVLVLAFRILHVDARGGHL